MFVYGTLRKGGGLNFKIQDYGTFVGKFRTEARYSMYDMGCPILSAYGHTSIVGEVYRVEGLVQIAHIHNMEIRAGYSLEPICLVGFATDPVYAYFQEPEPGVKLPLIESGDWLEHMRSLYVQQD